MTNLLNPWKRNCALGALALALAGLLTGPAARADQMDFYYASFLAGPVTTLYQPITNVHVTYTGVSVYAGVGVDHTTGYNSGGYFYAWQNFYLGLGSPAESYNQTYTFDRPVSLPSLYYACYLDQRTNQPDGETNITIQVYSDTAGTSLIYSNVVAGKGPPTTNNWQQLTDLAALGTNIMRVEFTAGAVAVVDDLTINRAPVGTLQRIHDFVWAQTNLVPGMTAQANIIADYTSDTNDVAPWCSYVSSDTTVAKFSSPGQLTAVGPGTATITATFQGNTLTQSMTILPQVPVPAKMVTFANPNSDGTYKAGSMPGNYEPVPGLTMSYVYVSEHFDGGPDHGWGAFQTDVGAPQEYDFSSGPVSLPSFRLTTRAGTGGGNNVVSISAYGASGLLGTETVTTPLHAGPGNFKWVQCTSFDQAKYNGQITSLLITAPGNAEVDDMVVVPNFGALGSVNVQIDVTPILVGATAQASAQANYASASGIAVTGRTLYDSSNPSGATASLVYSSANPSVATVNSNGVVTGVGMGTTKIWATVGTYSNSVDIQINMLDNTGPMLINFNDGLGAMGSPIALTNNSWEPVPELLISSSGWNLFNGLWSGTALLGPDHTTGVNGGNHYYIYENSTAPSVLFFNRPVAISSFWLMCGQVTKSTNVVIRAWSEPTGTTTPIYSNTVPTSPASGTWGLFTDFASLGTNIMRMDFYSTGTPCVDDLTLIAPPLGNLLALHLQLPPTNWVPNLAVVAAALADYVNVSNVIVTIARGTVYRSSDTNIVTVTTNGSGNIIVKGIAPGSANVTATLANVSNSVNVVVGNGTLTNLHLQLATTNLVTGASQQAAVLGDYQYKTGVDVTTNVAYSSSNPMVVTVSAGGLVTAVGPGSATVSAILSNITNSVAVTVTGLTLQYSASGSGGGATLTFGWPTNAPAGFGLESSPVLGPGAAWTTVTNTRTVVGSNYQVQVPIDPATLAAYFRLRLP